MKFSKGPVHGATFFLLVPTDLHISTALLNNIRQFADGAVSSIYLLYCSSKNCGTKMTLQGFQLRADFVRSSEIFFPSQL